jgi:hypothetical protein
MHVRGMCIGGRGASCMRGSHGHAFVGVNVEVLPFMQVGGDLGGG